MPQFRSAQIAEAFYNEVILSEESPHIRLLGVSPGAPTDLLICSLSVMHLKAKAAYKALSYSWAYQDESYDPLTHQIYCNNTLVAITANLDAALRRLRHEHDHVDIWVDWICINQTDLAERSRQVAMMRDIYESSEEVVIWLGDQDEHDDVGEWYSQRDMATSESWYIDWFGDERDESKWHLFIAEQYDDKGSDIRVNNVFGAFCIIWLLAVGIDASNIVHLRHLTNSAPLLNGLHSLMAKHWVRYGNCNHRASIDLKTVATYLGGPGDCCCYTSQSILWTHIGSVGHVCKGCFSLPERSPGDWGRVCLPLSAAFDLVCSDYWRDSGDYRYLPAHHTIHVSAPTAPSVQIKEVD